ncbi:MAG: hypothetical protein GXY52_09115 [Chloroflexi bacterium]|nr:hypothetical protein [Chloroflexota bacterium]
MRLWAYQGIAHGADGIVFFRWRSCRYNTEEYWHGILEHHGQPRRRYREVQQMGQELARISNTLTGGMSPKQVAMILNYDDSRTLRLQPGAQGLTFNWIMTASYRALHRLGVAIDIVPPDADLTPYKAVVAPILHLVDDALAENLCGYVAKGGTLWLGACSGVKDTSNRVSSEPLPGLLADLFGLEIEEYDAIGVNNSNGIALEIDAPALQGVRMNGSTWCDVLAPKRGTEVLARYTSDYYAGQPALTRSKYRSGQAYYLGTMLETPDLCKLFSWMLSEAGVACADELPEGLEVTQRVLDGKTLTFVLNHSASPVQYVLNGEMRELISGKTVSGVLELPAYEVAILT